MSKHTFSVDNVKDIVEDIFEKYNSRLATLPKPTTSNPKYDYIYATHKNEVRSKNLPMTYDELMEALERKLDF